MIRAVLIFNTNGKPRLVKFFEKLSESEEQTILSEIFSILSKRSRDSCNFLETSSQEKYDRIIYRQYSTIYIVFCVDIAESELGILDLIQVFVDLLDKTFENVCELDIIFNTDKVHYLLNELICGGIVLETNYAEILRHIEAQEVCCRQTGSASSLVDPEEDDKEKGGQQSGLGVGSVLTSTTNRLRQHLKTGGQVMTSCALSIVPPVTRWARSTAAQAITGTDTFDKSGFHHIGWNESDNKKATVPSANETQKLYS